MWTPPNTQDQMTQYINLLGSLRLSLIDLILSSLADTVHSANLRLAGYSVAMALVTGACLSLTAWYARRTHRIIGEMARQAKRIQLKSRELNDEKRRSDRLLYRMMPRSVVEQLRTTGEVEPKQYDSATVYFSDIVGFTEISASSEPMEVVMMLNDFYR